MQEVESGWIGKQLSVLQIGVVLGCSLMGMLVPALQPVLLVGLVAEHRLSVTQLGQTATVELLGMSIACAIAGALMKPVRLRWIAFFAGIVLIIANAATMFLSGYEIALARSFAGLSCGIYIWILMNMLARSHNSARYVGLLAIGQGVMALALSGLFSSVVIPRYGISGSYACLALIAMGLALASVSLPEKFDPLPSQPNDVSGLPPPLGLVGLLMSFFYVGGIVAVWVYVGAISHQDGHTAEVTARAFSISFAAQLIGGVGASWLSNKVAPMIAVTCGGMAIFVLAIGIGLARDPLLFTVAVAIFGFLWTFTTPYTIPLLFEFDPSRQAGMYTTSSQLLGCAAGPVFSAALVHGTDVRSAIMAGALMILVAIGIAIGTRHFASANV